MTNYEQFWMTVPNHALVDRGAKSFTLVSSQVAKYQTRLIRILEISEWAKVVPLMKSITMWVEQSER